MDVSGDISRFFIAGVENAYDGIVLMDLRGRIIFTNPAMERMLGYQPGGMVGLLSTKIGSGPAQARELKAKMLRDGAASGEVEGRRADGSIIPLQLSASFIRDAAGRPAAVMAVLRDLTETKRTEGILRDNAERFRLVADYTTDW